MFKKVTVEEQIRDTRQNGLLGFGNNKEDINDVAMTSAIVLEDSTSTAEIVGYLLLEIEGLKARISKLEGGK